MGLDSRAVVGATLEPVSLADASKKRGSAARGVVSREDALPEAVHDLLTDVQLAARWQLSRGTLANQRSQGRGPGVMARVQNALGILYADPCAVARSAAARLTGLDQQHATGEEGVDSMEEGRHRRLEGGLCFVPRAAEPYDLLTDPIVAAYVDPSFPSGRLPGPRRGNPSSG
jgi:hypothetical protein